MSILEKYFYDQFANGRYGGDPSEAKLCARAVRRFRRLFPNVSDGQVHVQERTECLKGCSNVVCTRERTCFGEFAIVNEGNRIKFLRGDTRPQHRERNILLGRVYKALGRN